MNFFFMTLSLFSFISCPVFPYSADEAVIHGEAQNNREQSIRIDDFKAPFDGKGTFAFKTVIDAPKTFLLQYGEFQFELFLEPGSKVMLRFDTNDIAKSMEFEGYSPDTQYYLLNTNALNKKFRNCFSTDSQEWQEWFSRDEPAFLEKRHELKSRFQSPLDELRRQGEHVNAGFLFKQQKSLDFAFDWLLLQYPHYHKQFTGVKKAFSTEAAELISQIKLDNPRFIGVDGYVRLGKALLHGPIREEFHADPALKKQDNQWLRASFRLVDRTFKAQPLIDFWRFTFLKDHIDNFGPKNMAPLVDRFNRACVSDDLKRELNDLYQKSLAAREGHWVRTYKTVDGFSLDVHLFIPKDIEKGEKRPVFVHFHGGSWSEGKPDWNFGVSKLGFVNACVEYRVYDRHRALPFQQIADAKSAIRFLRRHADEFNIDGKRIIASGDSAGGHLALCTALLHGFEEPGEPKEISSIPNALILNSAVFKVEKGVWFDDLVDDPRRLSEISPLEHISAGLPPMLLFHGTDDSLSSPFKHCESFVQEAKSAGNTVFFYPLEGLGHFIWKSGRYWKIYVEAERKFFQELGYLPPVSPSAEDS